MPVISCQQIIDNFDFALLRSHEHEATSRLLGTTIAFTDTQWQEPCRLPGWTRAHLGVHLAENAELLISLIDQLHASGKADLAAQPDQDLDVLERGSEKSAVDLQILLDTSAGKLNTALDSLTELSEAVIIAKNQIQLAAQLLPLARINEIYLHLVDLDCGFTLADIPDQVATWLLRLNVHRPLSTLPSAHLIADSGLEANFGPGAEQVEIKGSDKLLYGWLTGRLTTEELADLDWPATQRI